MRTVSITSPPLRVLVRSLLAACLLATACTQEPATTPDDGFRPDPMPEKGDIVLTVTPAAAEVPLGAEIVLKCRVENKGTVLARVSEPRLSSDSMSLRVRTADVDTAWIERRRVRETPSGPLPDSAVSKELAPGASIEGEIRVLAVAAGKWTFLPVYRCPSVPQPVTGAAFSVQVAKDGDNDRVGVRIETTHGTLTAALRPDVALNTCEAFASLTKRGFFDGTPFHRVIQGFMAQGGAPGGEGWSGPGYELRLEANAAKLPHMRGVLAMARRNEPDTAGSQFYVAFAPLPDLDAMRYTTFGELVKSEDALARIEAVGADRTGRNGEAPAEPVSIKKATLFNTKRP